MFSHVACFVFRTKVRSGHVSVNAVANSRWVSWASEESQAERGDKLSKLTPLSRLSYIAPVLNVCIKISRDNKWVAACHLECTCEYFSKLTCC